MSIDWSRVVSIEDLRRLAQRHVPHPLFDFIDGGAEDELSLAENRAAYDRWKWRPRVFADVSAIDTEVELSVSGVLVHGRLVQHFRNPTAEVVEALYVFPLPDRAAPKAVPRRRPPAAVPPAPR